MVPRFLGDTDSGVGLINPARACHLDTCVWHSRALMKCELLKMRTLESAPTMDHAIKFMWPLDWSRGSLYLHQNDIEERPRRDWFFFPHPPSPVVLFPHLRRCPPYVLVIRCSEPSPGWIHLGRCPYDLNWTYRNRDCLRHQAARENWFTSELLELGGVFRVQDPYTHIYHT